MTEPVYQQTPYPFVLALSVALFLHVLLATAVSAWVSLPDPEEPPPNVAVRLIAGSTAPESRPARPTSREAAEQSPPPVKETRDPGEASKPSAASTPGDTDRDSDRSGDASDAPGSSEAKEAPTDSEPREPEADTAPASASSQGEDTPVTLLSREQTEQRSDYEIALWERIAQQVGYSRGMAKLERPSEVVLELRLMTNGALRRARVTTSSGVEELDSAAREAALEATPFPEPPDGRQRFRVRLVFEPDSR